ncbi:MAG: type II toxin-antitoxin system Phd/YefM family antitoxin [Phycisphaerae bacterium]|nr:type II toxin-antitoxin system Phd/YefM family antitoxin [Phycisphaerae bacterium]
MKGKNMTTISMSEIRLKLSELANRVIYGGERVIVEKNNKPAFGIVSMEDIELLERLEDEIDIKAAEEALKEGNFIPLDKLVKELGVEEGDTDKDVQG